MSIETRYFITCAINDTSSIIYEMNGFTKLKNAKLSMDNILANNNHNKLRSIWGNDCIETMAIIKGTVYKYPNGYVTHAKID